MSLESIMKRRIEIEEEKLRNSERFDAEKPDFPQWESVDSFIRGSDNGIQIKFGPNVFTLSPSHGPAIRDLFIEMFPLDGEPAADSETTTRDAVLLAELLEMARSISTCDTECTQGAGSYWPCCDAITFVNRCPDCQKRCDEIIDKITCAVQ